MLHHSLICPSIPAAIARGRGRRGKAEPTLLMAAGPPEGWNTPTAPLLSPESKTKTEVIHPHEATSGRLGQESQTPAPCLTCLPSSSFPEMGILQEGKDMKNAQRRIVCQTMKCIRPGSPCPTGISSSKSLLASLISVLRLEFESQEKHGTTCPALWEGPTETTASKAQRETYAHCGIYLGHCLFVRRELVDLDAVADQLAHDFTLELVQLVFGDGVSLGNDGDDVHLQDKDSSP